ncbi:putative Ulp1-like cysteine protease [Namao virus]|nr:putative Ulp1-like cysteine protease [Namao virus]
MSSIIADNTMCAPGVDYVKNGNSCFPREILIKLYFIYDNITRVDQWPTENIVKALKKKITETKQPNNCSIKDEICWLKLNPKLSQKVSDLEKVYLKPAGPQVGIKWISNIDLDGVLTQYESYYPYFKYLGCFMRDFEKNIPSFYYSVQKMFNEGKYYYYAMVINLDKYSEKGSHWVTLYIDIKNYKVYYFDSNGDDPGYIDNKIPTFINKIISYLKTKQRRDKRTFLDIVSKVGNQYRLLSYRDYMAQVNYYFKPSLPDVFYKYLQYIYFNHIIAQAVDMNQLTGQDKNEFIRYYSEKKMFTAFQLAVKHCLANPDLYSTDNLPLDYQIKKFYAETKINITPYLKPFFQYMCFWLVYVQGESEKSVLKELYPIISILYKKKFIDKELMLTAYETDFSNMLELGYHDIMADISLTTIDYKSNKRALQMTRTECGIYSILFIIHLLEKKSFKDAVGQMGLTDDIAIDARFNLFRKAP